MSNVKGQYLNPLRTYRLPTKTVARPIPADMAKTRSDALAAEYNYLVARKVFVKGGLTEIQMYWDDEKELRLLAFAKELVLRIGVEGVAELMREDVSDGNP